MARVINIKSFVKMFTTECEENMYVEIEDDFIEENNGKWNIHLGRKRIHKVIFVMKIEMISTKK